MSALDVATDAVAKQWDDYMGADEARQVASAVLADLAAAGFHVVSEGKAVVRGQILELRLAARENTPLYWAHPPIHKAARA